MHSHLHVVFSYTRRPLAISPARHLPSFRQYYVRLTLQITKAAVRLKTIVLPSGYVACTLTATSSKVGFTRYASDSPESSFVAKKTPQALWRYE